MRILADEASICRQRYRPQAGPWTACGSSRCLRSAAYKGGSAASLHFDPCVIALVRKPFNTMRIAKIQACYGNP